MHVSGREDRDQMSNPPHSSDTNSPKQIKVSGKTRKLIRQPSNGFLFIPFFHNKIMFGFRLKGRFCIIISNNWKSGVKGVALVNRF